MMNLAIFGFGTVGSGVWEIITNNPEHLKNKTAQSLNVKYILDIREFPDHPAASIITKKADDIFNDTDVNIIVETIGGTGIAYELSKRALLSKRHVVTSNKELVAAHGPELFDIANRNKVCYLYEACVGGGIPIIKSMKESLEANKIESIEGILNGTTNYILGQMFSNKISFADALKAAQKNGYAEANPAADIEGYDSVRKLAILSSLAFNKFIDYRKIPTEGIQNITLDNLEKAFESGAKIKLIATSKMQGDKLIASVRPTLINESHPLYNVEDVNNAIVLNCNNVGQVMFYGPGAGKLPTASAVVGDIVDIAKTMIA